MRLSKLREIADSEVSASRLVSYYCCNDQVAELSVMNRELVRSRHSIGSYQKRTLSVELAEMRHGSVASFSVFKVAGGEVQLDSSPKAFCCRTRFVVAWLCRQSGDLKTIDRTHLGTE